MGCSCCDVTGAFDNQFTAKKAATELQAYRRGKVGPTTRLIRDGLVKTGLNRGVVLDVGGGVGALGFELLQRGVSRVVDVDASAPYLSAATEEASRRQCADQMRFVHGDFVAVAETIPAADVVTLDRVVCCYADYVALLSKAIGHAGRGLALSYPHDRWYVRCVLGFDNLKRRFRSNPFRTFVHPPARMEALMVDAGLELISRRRTLIWSADIYVRR